MTTLLDHLDSRSSPTATAGTSTTPAHRRLRTTMAAVRVSFTWMGTQKTLNPDQKARAAETFGAEGQLRSPPARSSWTRRHSAFRSVTAIRGKVDAYWKGLSLPYPENGREADQARRRRDVRRPDGRLQGRAGRRRGQPRPPLRRAEGGRSRSAGIAVQPGGLSRDPRRALRRRVGLPQRRAAGLPRSAQPRDCTRPSGPGSRPGSRRRWCWPSKLSSTSSPGSSRT